MAGYARLSNGFWQDKDILKLRRMNPSAALLYVMAISWCSDHASDGIIADDELLYVLNTTDLRETQQLLKQNPLPHWCRVCGQRFEYTLGDHISCSSEFSITETMDTLKSMFPTEQPNFETIVIEAAREDGERNG